MIEVVYKLTENEFVEARKVWCQRQVRKLPGFWVQRISSVLLGAFIGWSLHYLPDWLEIAVVASGALSYLVSLWRKRAARIYQYRLRDDERKQVSVKIDDVGYHATQPDASSGWVAWNGFTGWLETEKLFILGRGTVYITVPKRPLSAEQHQELREYCLNQVPEKT